MPVGETFVYKRLRSHTLGFDSLLVGGGGRGGRVEVVIVDLIGDSEEIILKNRVESMFLLCINSF